MALGAVVGGAVWSRGPLAGVALAAGVLVAVASVRVPHHWWPAVLLLATMAAPGALLPLPGNGSGNGATSPALVVVLVWAVLELRQRWTGAPRPSLPPVVLAATSGLVAWTGVTTVLSTAPVTSASWTVNLVALGVLPVLLTGPRGADALLRTWVTAGAVLGAYALLEGFVIDANPVWGWLGGSGGDRARASSPHPLAAALFFACTLVLAVVRWLSERRAATAACALLIAGGLAAAGSRGALIAAGCGIAGVLLPALLRWRGALRVPVVAVVVVVAAGAGVAAVGLMVREGAGDADGSLVVRARGGETGLLLAREAGWLGFGPGTAYTVKTATPGPANDEGRSIENAWLELVVATGVVGVVLFAATLAALLVVAVRHRRWGPAGALVTFAVDLATFNALEGARPNSMVLLGLLLALCLTAPGDRAVGAAHRSAVRPALGATAPSAPERR